MRSMKKGSTPFEGCSLSMKRLMAAPDRLSCCPFRLPAAEREQLQGSRMCRRMLRASLLSAGRSRQRGQKQSAARMRKKRRAARAMRLGRLDGLSSSFDPSRRRRTSQQAAWPPASLKALKQNACLAAFIEIKVARSQASGGPAECKMKPLATRSAQDGDLD